MYACAYVSLAWCVFCVVGAYPARQSIERTRSSIFFEQIMKKKLAVRNL